MSADAYFDPMTAKQVNKPESGNNIMSNILDTKILEMLLISDALCHNILTRRAVLSHILVRRFYMVSEL